MKILGLMAIGNDPSACLVTDGKIVAMAEEERFVGIKHANMMFPKKAIKFCLDRGNVELKDLDYIAIGWDLSKYPGKIAEHFLKTWYEYPTKGKRQLDWEISKLRKFTKENFEKELISKFEEAGFKKEDLPPRVYKSHHYCHAVSAYVASGFKEASIITMDGHGEENCTVLWEVRNGNFKKIKEINLPHSLGHFYGAFTKFSGFRIYNGEGKTMGLAPYGKKNLKFRKVVDKMCKITEDGYKIDPTYLFYGKSTIADEFSDKFSAAFGEMRRGDKEEIKDNHKEAAFEAQRKIEHVGRHLAEWLIDKTGIHNLCLAGGVAFNCKMNGFIQRSEKVKNIYIQPVSGDNGVGIGAAAALYIENGLDVSGFRMEHVYLGPEYSGSEIESALKEAGLKYTRSEIIAKEAAQHMADGKVVGWFQGKMEVGPRALGSRSILADPRDSEMKDIVNNKVKFRDSWRPFCPSILWEKTEDYFEHSCYHPFMILTFKVKKEKRDVIPSVVHVDGTARPQTVKKDVSPLYWKLINEFYKITGVPVVLNTSFNIKGEPIVCTPRDAINCYLKTGMDVLAIGNFIVTSKDRI
jgi:carbamoyltransferase